MRKNRKPQGRKTLDKGLHALAQAVLKVFDK
jgi:hypothetical protein